MDLLVGAYLVPTTLFTAWSLWRRPREDSHGYHRAAAIGVLAAPGVLVLDVVAHRLGTAVQIWGWAALATVAVVLSGTGFVQRFRLIAKRVMLVQLSAEVLLVAAFVTIAAWEWLFAEPARAAGQSLGTGFFVTAFALLVSVLLVSSIREPRYYFTKMGISALPAVLAEPVAIHLEFSSGPQWLGSVWTVLAWSLLFGSLLISSRAESSDYDSLDSSRTAVIGVTSAVLLGLSVACLMVDTQVEPLTWAMIGVVVAAIGTRDVTQARRAQQMNQDLREQALHDPLTGLGNRRAFDQWIQQAPERTPSPVSLLNLDLDQFKDVNDLLGHNTGDRLLQVIADALRRAAKATHGRVFRMGGDEFIVVSPLQADAAQRLAADLITVVERVTSEVPGVSRLGLGASIGVQHVPDSRDGALLLDAIIQSGQALRAAKLTGKRRVLAFDETLQTDYRRRKVVELRLREQMHDVGVHYQPIMAASGGVAGFEALARWTDPELGVVPPAEFIEVAEHSNLIVDLGLSILTRSVREMVGSGHLGAHRHLNVNVSALQLRMPSFVDRVFDVLDEYGLPRHQLVLELTESATLQHDGPGGQALQRLSAGGVQLAIDDFGAGATSVGYLSQLPVTSVKIDRSLTQGITEGASTGILGGVVGMCRALDPGETDQEEAVSRRRAAAARSGTSRRGPARW